MSDSPEFQLFLSMKRYFQFQQAVHKDRDNAEDAQKHSNAHAILQYCESVKTEMWDQLRSKLMPLMESNKISQSLSEPQSDQDFDVLEFLMRYVHTDPDQRRSLPTPLARLIPPTWTEWFKQKGVSWISARGLRYLERI